MATSMLQSLPVSLLCDQLAMMPPSLSMETGASIQALRLASSGGSK